MYIMDKLEQDMVDRQRRDPLLWKSRVLKINMNQPRWSSLFPMVCIPCLYVLGDVRREREKERERLDGSDNIK